MAATNNLLIFLIDILISMYAGAVLLRIILAFTRADFYNPISQFLVSITDPVLLPLRKIIPSLGSIDTASWILILILQGFRIFSLAQLNGIELTLSNLLVASILQIISTILSILIYAILIRAVLSWFQSPHQQQNPLVSIIESITEPLLRPVRKILPPATMIDLSAFFVIIFLYCLQIILRSF
jgi:YggT family protein